MRADSFSAPYTRGAHHDTPSPLDDRRSLQLSLGLSGLANAAGRAAGNRRDAGDEVQRRGPGADAGGSQRGARAEKDGETLEWKSDKTPASGSVTALDRLQWNGLACRRLRISNAYGDLKAQGVYKFCEKPAGQWKLVGPD